MITRPGMIRGCLLAARRRLLAARSKAAQLRTAVRRRLTVIWKGALLAPSSAVLGIRPYVLVGI